MSSIDPWLEKNVVCPRDEASLRFEGDRLVCEEGHDYRVVDGIPILLRDDVDSVHWVVDRALELPADELLEASKRRSDAFVHSFVQSAIGATNGYMYGELAGKLEDYPIPELRAEPSGGKRFLEIGCNWGRWCFAAARAGFEPVGIDPSYEAIHAARSVARQLGLDVHFTVGDARFPPFPRELFDFVFSYSVLQHLPREQVRMALSETRRLLRPGGRALIQMPNRLGLRSIYHQARRAFREAEQFEVRYWSIASLERTFDELIGPTETFVDGFLSLNAQPADRAILPLRYRAVITLSERLRRLSERVSAFKHVADSIYVQSTKPVAGSAIPSPSG